jgi:hypothetical protein
MPMGRSIVDFAERKLRLAIEVDGSPPGAVAGLARDTERDAFLRSSGFQVLGFWDVDIDTNVSGVIDSILLRLRASSQLLNDASPLPCAQESKKEIQHQVGDVTSVFRHSPACRTCSD